jgi:TonB family protein
MKTNNSEEQGIFTTGTSISESRAWFFSLFRQLREFREERRHPAPHVEITAERDPSALDKLVDPPSQLSSLYSSIKAIIQEKLHPHHIEMTATPVEVEELWSKKENHVAGLLSLLAHVGVVTAIIVLSLSTYNKPKKAVADDTVLLEPISLSLPPAAVKSGGGGGGGVKAPKPASKGVLPKAADKQFVPPTPLITKVAPELAAEPTIVAPQLANLLKVTDLVHMGDPNGLPTPPSAGPGSGGGIGDGTGHGVGTGNGAGAGPGSGGGIGGGVYRVGGTGGASAPSCPRPSLDPSYTDDARKAHVQGTVRLNAVVNSDGTISVKDVVQKIGFGLDDEARKFVEKYFKCKPGLVQGQPVATSAVIDVSFHLF